MSFGSGIWESLAGLFLQALQLCQKAGLVKLGHVAVDGTKQQANASKHKAMSYGRMSEAEEKLKAKVAELLARAEAVDAAEDEKERQGQSEELPKELARQESRLKKIQEAKAELEAEAREKAQQEKAAVEARIAERRQKEAETGKKRGGREPQIPDPEQAVTGRKSATQLHRLGEPDHARWRAQREFRASLQCADRGR